MSTFFFPVGRVVPVIAAVVITPFVYYALHYIPPFAYYAQRYPPLSIMMTFYLLLIPVYTIFLRY